MLKIFHSLTWILAIALVAIACEEKEYALPAAKTHLQNDAIKRSIGPNVAGLDLEFVYAMALGYGRGNILQAQVEASIPGAEGTYMEHRSFHTNLSGDDEGVEIGEPSTTTGAKTVVNFTLDTCAAALRYFYKIPEAARGQAVEFTFSASASTGETVSYKMGPYQIARMEMQRDIVLTDGSMNYFSISNMQAYDSAAAAANPGAIDLVYLYRPIDGIVFNHALVSPSANADFLPSISLPGNLNNQTRIYKTWQLNDQHLARLQYGIFVDDPDFEKIDVSNAPDYAINLRGESGAWVQTADGKYKAYVYVNSVNNGSKSITISIKRLQMN